LFDVRPPDEPPPSDVLRGQRTRADKRSDAPVTEAEFTRGFGYRDLVTKLFHILQNYTDIGMVMQ
jgi:hypothetical protein